MRSQIGRPAADAGFTVLELLVALAVLALTAVAVAAALPPVFDRLSVDRAADRLEAMLEDVADAAVRTGQDQTLILRQEGSSLTVQAAERIVEIGSPIAARWTAAVEAGSDRDQAVITFWGAGGASGGTFELRHGDAQATLEIDWLTAAVQRRG